MDGKSRAWRHNDGMRRWFLIDGLVCSFTHAWAEGAEADSAGGRGKEEVARVAEKASCCMRGEPA
jgi:hypothetical protein